MLERRIKKEKKKARKEKTKSSEALLGNDASMSGLLIINYTYYNIVL